jgi:hypothetical protein
VNKLIQGIISIKTKQNFFLKKTFLGLKSYCRTEGEILAKNRTNMPKSYLAALFTPPCSEHYSDCDAHQCFWTDLRTAEAEQEIEEKRSKDRREKAES